MIPLDVMSSGLDKDRISRSQQSRVIYRANCWDCNGFYIGKTKRRLHDRKTEHFKALAKNDNTSAIADHVKAAGHITSTGTLMALVDPLMIKGDVKDIYLIFFYGS